MNKKSKSRVRGVAILVIFLALAITLFNFGKNQRSTSKASDFKESKDEFEQKRKMVLNSASLSLDIINLDQAKEELRSLRSYHKGDLFHTSEKGNSLAYIYYFALPDYDRIIDKLSNSSSVKIINSNSTPGSVSADETELLTRLEGYKKQRVTLLQKENPTQDIHEQIDRLNNDIEKTSEELQKVNSKDSVLVYFSAFQQVKEFTLLSTGKTLLLDFLKWLVVLFIGVIIVYFGTKLMVYLLALMGIKGLGPTGVNYGSGYNYTGYKGYKGYDSYGYGGHSHKRKTKRIYKEKEANNTENKV